MRESASVKVTGVAAVAGPLLVTTWVYVMGSPARTVVTEGVFVTERSASPAIETFVIVVALLLAGIGSVVDEVAEAVLLMGLVVPDLIISGKLAVPPEIREVVFVQVRVRGFPDGAGQVQPVGATIDENVVPVGMTSVNVTFKASLGPLFVNVCVYVRVLFIPTGEGVADAAIDRSACATTKSDIVTVLLAETGSVRVVETVPVSLRTVPFGVTDGSATITLKGPADVPDGRLLPFVRLHEIAPVLPTVGAVQLYPAGGVTDMKVVVPGVEVASTRELLVTQVTFAGPLLVTVNA